jgi:hypothetical protein
MKLRSFAALAILGMAMAGCATMGGPGAASMSVPPDTASLPAVTSIPATPPSTSVPAPPAEALHIIDAEPASFLGIGEKTVADILGLVNKEFMEQTRQITHDQMESWLLTHGLIDGALRGDVEQLPQSLVDAMTELDRIAEKPTEEITDYELGYGLGLRLNVAGETVKVIVKGITPLLDLIW